MSDYDIDNDLDVEGGGEEFPEWLLAISEDGREFVVHLHQPRFFVEARPARYQKWRMYGFGESEGQSALEKESLVKKACQYYVSQTFGL